MVACILKTLKSNRMGNNIAKVDNYRDYGYENTDKDIRRGLVYVEQELSGWHPIFPPDGIE